MGRCICLLPPAVPGAVSANLLSLLGWGQQDARDGLFGDPSDGDGARVVVRLVDDLHPQGLQAWPYFTQLAGQAGGGAGKLPPMEAQELSLVPQLSQQLVGLPLPVGSSLKER